MWIFNTAEFPPVTVKVTDVFAVTVGNGMLSLPLGGTVTVVSGNRELKVTVTGVTVLVLSISTVPAATTSLLEGAMDVPLIEKIATDG